MEPQYALDISDKLLESRTFKFEKVKSLITELVAEDEFLFSKEVNNKSYTQLDCFYVILHKNHAAIAASFFHDAGFYEKEAIYENDPKKVKILLEKSRNAGERGLAHHFLQTQYKKYANELAREMCEEHLNQFEPRYDLLINPSQLIH